MTYIYIGLRDRIAFLLCNIKLLSWEYVPHSISRIDIGLRHTLYSFFIHDLVFENDFKEKEKAQQVGCKADSPSDMFNDCEATHTHHYIGLPFENILILI